MWTQGVDDFTVTCGLFWHLSVLNISLGVFLSWMKMSPPPFRFVSSLSTKLSSLGKKRQDKFSEGKGRRNSWSLRVKAADRVSEGREVTGGRGCLQSLESWKEWQFAGGLMDEPVVRVGWGYGHTLACSLFQGYCCSSLKIQPCQCPALSSPRASLKPRQLNGFIEDSW